MSTNPPGAGSNEHRQLVGGQGFPASRLGGLVIALVTLSVCYGKVLRDLVYYGCHSELYSYVLLVPFVTAYLIWARRAELGPVSAGLTTLIVTPILGGVAVVAGLFWARFGGWSLSQEDYLFLGMLSFYCFALGIAVRYVGEGVIRSLTFPLGLLVFSAPFPSFLLRAAETFLQHRSADVAAILFRLSGLPILREGTFFQLPGIALQVAPECSGIHSTLALFIVSLVAGNLFLRTFRGRMILTVSVIPLALLRNGFRVFTIGELCVRISPDMINSYIHRRGGPIFFALSLVPFLLLLLFLRKFEPRGSSLPPPSGIQAL